MASPCCVHYCTNIGTHRFPKEEVRRTEWIQAIKYVKPGLTIRKHSLICSAHFRQTDFAVTCTTKDRTRKIIKKNAVPSIFAWNQQQQEVSQELVFDRSRVQATYSRTPPIQYVDTFPFLETQAEENVDPLQLSEEEENQQADIVTNDVLSNQAEAPEETEQDEDLPQLLIYLNEIDDNIIEIDSGKSVETQTHLGTTQQGFSIETQTQNTVLLKPNTVPRFVLSSSDQM